MGYMSHKYATDIANARQYDIKYKNIPFGCWIGLNGNVYRTHYAEHCILAHQILCITFKKSYDDTYEFTDNDDLIKKGWILIQRSGNFSGTYTITCKKTSLITPQQHDTLKKIKKELEKHDKRFFEYEIKERI